MSTINKKIQNLANINEDASEFYEQAQDKTENSRLKSTFQNLERLHRSVVINLQEHIRANGGTPNTEETFIGEAREFWGKLMAAVSNDVDETLIKHLEEAEDRCLHKMQDIMEDDDVSMMTKSVLQKEYASLKRSHDYMKALKESS